MLRGRAYGESDKIVTFLTRDFGKLSGIAKGAAKSKKRFVAALEPFTHVQLGFRSRPQTDLCFIESADIVRAARHAALDLDRYAYSTYVVELIDSMVVGREAEPHVFELVEEVLALIDSPAKASPAPEWLRHFEVRLLGLSGLEPQLESCGRCGLSASSFEEALRFNPRTGSVSCVPCSDGAGMRLSVSAANAILGLRRGPATDVAALPSPLAAEVRVALQTFIQYHLHRPLKSPALLRQILDA